MGSNKVENVGNTGFQLIHGYNFFFVLSGNYPNENSTLDNTFGDDGRRLSVRK